MKETLPQAPHKPRRLLPKLLLALAAVLAALMLAVLLLFQRELRTLGYAGAGGEHLAFYHGVHRGLRL